MFKRGITRRYRSARPVKWEIGRQGHDWWATIPAGADALYGITE